MEDAVEGSSTPAHFEQRLDLMAAQLALDLRAAVPPRRNAEIGGDDARIVARLGGRAVGDLLAIIEHDDVVGDAHHHAHVVLDQQE